MTQKNKKIRNENLIRKVVKREHHKISNNIKDLEVELEILKEVLKLKSFDKVEIETKEVKKFKKSVPVQIEYVYGRWDEDFVDEDNGEVVTITRSELIAVKFNNSYYYKWDELYNKGKRITEIFPYSYSESLVMDKMIK